MNLWAALDSLPEPEPDLRLVPPPRDYGLRWYQQEEKEATEECLRRARSCISVMATGTGKTRSRAALAGDWDGNVLWLAHRDELIQQAVHDLEAVTGETVEVEQGQLRASSRARIVVGSVDTVKRQNRLDRMGRDRFSLIIPDECHHFPARTYRRTLEFFDAKVAGMTATPDRGDEKALGQLFEEVAYVFDIQQGIEQGYLVPIRAHSVEVKSIDISGVSTVAGDLVAAQLDEVMLKACSGIVSETLKYEPDRQGIGFMPGVKSAEFACRLCNQQKPGSAAFVSGSTPPEERREIVEAFRSGRIQYLWNCALFVEGTDFPNASLVIQGTPTKSRALSAQQIGRGGRVLPGLVDDLDGRDRADERRDRIAHSSKRDCVVLDFVGNCGRHCLVSPEDVLGGNFTHAEVALARQRKEKCGGDILAALKAARLELARVAQAARISAESVRTEIDPFSVFHVRRNPFADRYGRQPMTQGQFGYLKSIGVSEDSLNTMSKTEAGKLIATARERREKGLAAYAQLSALQRFGVTETKVTQRAAAEALEYLYAVQKNAGAIDSSLLAGILRGR